MKLKKCLVILPLLALTLSACNTTTVSEPLDSSSSSEESGSTSEEDTQTTFTNYTLSIEIRYNGDVEKVPEYATAYIEGSWDSWAGFVALTPSEDGRYEYTFASIDLGTYEYQLVLAYENDEPSWTYRITQDGANASFTVDASDGDNYVNEVIVTSEKALEVIIPDPSAAINNVKVTIDITLDGVSQEVLDYGTLWIEGSWDWSKGFVACSVEDGKYVYTFTSLAPIEYEFLGVIYYKDEQLPDDNTLWDYKVNGNTDCTFTVDSNDVGATLVATKALSEILPPIGGDGGESGEGGSQDNDTYSINVANADSLLALEYDGNATEQQVVVLNISLVTTKGDGSSTSITASADDVTFTGYDSSIISISSLTITPVGAGTTSLTISWGEYASTTLTVVVSDTTVSEEPSEEDPNLEAAQAILEAVSENGLEDWEAFHGVSTDDEGTQEVYLTTLNDATYGVRYYYEGDFKTTEQYFVEGTNYTYDLEEEEYSTSTTVPSFSGSLSAYSDAIDAIDDIDLDDEDEYSYVLSEDNDGYKLVVTDSYSGSTTIYTYVVDTDYTLLEVGSDFTGSQGYSESSYAIKITYQDVASVMASFDASDWDQQVWESGDTITLYFTFTYNGQVETLEEYEQIYIIGGWNGADWDSNDAKALTLGDDNETYYAEFTYQSGEDVVTDGHWFSFNLFIASTSESYSWNEERKLLTDNGTWSWENGLLSASWDVELSKPFAEYIDDPSTITTRYNCTVTYYFVDSAENPQEYYSIPSYADAYVTGYLTLDGGGNGVWTDYSIGGDTKLAAAGEAASAGYSVTFSEIHTGTVTYNMYFEYNGSASYHSAAESATWNADHAICSDTSNNTTMYIPTTGDCEVYIELDPNQIITDEPMTNAVDFYILFVDTGSFSETFSWTPWVSAGGAAFSGSTSCSGVVSTTNSGKMCIYNETVGTYEAGQSDYYWIWAENIYGDSGKLDISTGTITIPSNSTGYAVYVCNVSFSSGGQGSGTWYTNVADITTLIASL